MERQVFSLTDFRKGKQEPIEWLKETQREELEEIAFKITKDRRLSSTAIRETFDHLNGIQPIFVNLPEIINFLKDFTATAANEVLFRHELDMK